MLWYLRIWDHYFWLMKEKRPCSIVFHLLVAGGKWQTVMANPVSSASCCTSHFHKRTRDPLLPPSSALIKSRFASGYWVRPASFHQRRRRISRQTLQYRGQCPR